MKLYHGTSISSLTNIFESQSLKPRCISGKESHWEEHPSMEDFVYLSTAYPVFYAINAPGNGAVVLEIDTDFLDEAAFYPDEDAVEQAFRTVIKEPIHDDYVKGTAIVRDAMMAGENIFFSEDGEKGIDWKNSIKVLGNCCYRGEIPLSAVNRIAVFSRTGAGKMLMLGIDPTMTLMNYSILGPWYEQITQWIFEPEKDYSTFNSFRMDMGKKPEIEESIESMYEYREKLDKMRQDMEQENDLLLCEQANLAGLMDQIKQMADR